MKDQSKKNVVIICYSTLLAIMPVFIVSIIPLIKQKINAYASSLTLSSTSIFNIDSFLYQNYMNYFPGLLTGLLAGIILFFIIRKISSYASLPTLIGCIIGILFSLVGCLSFLSFLGLNQYFFTLFSKISLNSFLTSYDTTILFQVSLIFAVYLFILIELLRLKKEKKWHSIKNPNIEKIDSSKSLLNLATDKQNLHISPSAFGEGNPKRRIKNILNFKKPTFYIIVTVVILLAATIIGLIANPLDKSMWLNENEIVATFESHDLALEEDNSKNPSDYAIVGTKPGIYKLKENEKTLYIYIFDNLNERYTKYNHWLGSESVFDGMINTSYSKNAVIIFERPFLDADKYFETDTLASSISDTVFLYLNDGKTAIYNGQSKNWRGTYTLKYYNNPITDQNGTLSIDDYGWGIYQLEYIGDNPKSIINVSVDYNRDDYHNEETGLNLNDEEIVTFGNSGGNGTMSDPPLNLTFTVMWNSQEETFVLKP